MGSGRISNGVKAAAANAAIFLGSLTPPYEFVNGALTGRPHFFNQDDLSSLAVR
jgi:hypothetical protein